MGAWIEIDVYDFGLKYHVHVNEYGQDPVAPLVGAWIEICFLSFSHLPVFVAPLVGAWIEIHIDMLSIPLILVAPLVGAWIEI